jgi:hypothetical protein
MHAAGIERVGGRIHMLLERIDAQIPWSGNRRFHRLPREPVILNHEMYFPILISDGEELMFPVIEKFMPGRRVVLTN